MLLLRVILEKYPKDQQRAFDKIGEKVIQWSYKKKFLEGKGKAIEKYLGEHVSNPLLGLLVFTLGPKEGRKNLLVRTIYITKVEKKNDKYHFQYVQGDWKYVHPDEFNKIIRPHFMAEEIKDAGRFLMEMEKAKTYTSGHEALQRITLELLREKL